MQHPICPSAVEGTLFFAVQWRCCDDVNRINYLEMKPSAITKAIVSSTQWETLDFEDLEKSLSAKLSDVDILLQFCHVSKQQSHQVEVGRMCQVFRGAVCNHWQDQIS